MADPINVFIPAAGRGERLQTITFHVPKPLVPIAGKPLLEIILEKVSLLPVRRFGINLHYKADVIEDWMRRSAFRERSILFPEEPVLGTGGALKNAERLLSEGIFLVHNSDILSDIDLERLIELHRASGNLVTLAVHDFPRFNTVAVDSDGLLMGVGNSLIRQSPVERRVTFTGIAVYDPQFLRFLPEGISSVVDAWIAAASSGHRVGTLDVSGCHWSDIGTPSSYAAAVIHRMRSEGETIYIHPFARGCHDAEMDGYVVMEENSTVERGASVRNCILLPGSKVDKNIHRENCIIGPDFVIPLTEGEMLGSSGDEHLFLIGTGGSDRKYYRMRDEKGSSVLVRYSRDDQDLHRHLAYTDFFWKCGIPVPELLKADPEKREALFEDLGDLSLYGWLKCLRPEEEVETMYRKVIDIAVMLHTAATAHVSGCPLIQERIFDYDHLGWETRYFMENFVSWIRHMRVKDASLMEGEFHRLAMKVDSFLKTVIHRDLQSQNIMVTRGGIPRLIDYQGARIGPPAYDIASLLWDPYYRLEGRLRERLLNYYVGQMKEKGSADFIEGVFRDTLLPCRLQRHMQALGAYGFLSAVKGKKYFLKHVEEGVRLFKEDISTAKDEYPALYELALAL
ncbi:MAG: phosphotransferase [Nitrospirae bacterium]|nr:phosphotransferase [Nitrospirota bacterium]MCL5422300.1 phosphotransferase [Nitrospirota bacterium]